MGFRAQEVQAGLWVAEQQEIAGSDEIFFGDLRAALTPEAVTGGVQIMFGHGRTWYTGYACAVQCGACA